MQDETPAEHNRRLYPEMMSKLDRFALCYGSSLDFADAEMRVIALMADNKVPLVHAAEMVRNMKPDNMDGMIFHDYGERRPRGESLRAYGDRLDGYKLVHSIMAFDVPPMPVDPTWEEENAQHNRRRAGKLTAKDRRDISRDAKQAMIDRALAKMKKGKR